MKTKNAKLKSFKLPVAIVSVLAVAVTVLGIYQYKLDAAIEITNYDHFGLSEDENGNLWEYYYNDDEDTVNVSLYNFDESLSDFTIPSEFIQSAAGVEAGSGHGHCDLLDTVVDFTGKTVVLNTKLDMPLYVDGGGFFPFNNNGDEINSDIVDFLGLENTSAENLMEQTAIIYSDRGEAGGCSNWRISSENSRWVTDYCYENKNTLPAPAQGYDACQGAINSLLYNVFTIETVEGHPLGLDEVPDQFKYNGEIDPYRFGNAADTSEFNTYWKYFNIMGGGQEDEYGGYSIVSDWYGSNGKEYYEDAFHVQFAFNNFGENKSYVIVYGFGANLTAEQKRNREDSVYLYYEPESFIPGENGILLHVSDEDYRNLYNSYNHRFKKTASLSDEQIFSLLTNVEAQGSWTFLDQYDNVGLNSVTVGDVVYTDADVLSGIYNDINYIPAYFAQTAQYPDGINGYWDRNYYNEYIWYPEDDYFRSGLDITLTEFDEDLCDIVIDANIDCWSLDEYGVHEKIGIIKGREIGKATFIQLIDDFDSRWVGGFYLVPTAWLENIESGTGNYYLDNHKVPESDKYLNYIDENAPALPEFLDHSVCADLCVVDVIADSSSLYKILNSSDEIRFKDNVKICCQLTQEYAYDGYFENIEHALVLDNYALYGAKFTNTDLVFDRLEYIGTAAFANSTVTSVDLGPNITNLAGLDKDNFPLNSVFAHCHDLTSFDFSKYNRIGRTMFWDTGLIEADLTGYTLVDWGAFYGCANLSHIEIPDMTSVGSYAFYGCSSLDGVEFGENLTEICDYAFAECTSLTCADLSGTQITMLAQDAFKNDTSLTGESVDLGNVEYIGYECFRGCTGLGDVDLQNVKWVGQAAFADSGLTHVNLRNVEVIGYRAFSGNNCTEWYLPSTILELNVECFEPADISVPIDVTIAYNLMGVTAPSYYDDLDCDWAYTDEFGNILDPETTDFSNPLNRRYVEKTREGTSYYKRSEPMYNSFGEFFYCSHYTKPTLNISFDVNDTMFLPEGSVLGYQYDSMTCVRSVDNMYGHHLVMSNDMYDCFKNSNLEPDIYVKPPQYIEVVGASREYDYRSGKYKWQVTTSVLKDSNNNVFDGVAFKMVEENVRAYDYWGDPQEFYYDSIRYFIVAERTADNVADDILAHKVYFMVQGAAKAYNANKGFTTSQIKGTEKDLASIYSKEERDAMPSTMSSGYVVTEQDLLNLGYTQDEIDSMDYQMSSPVLVHDTKWSVFDDAEYQYDENGIQYGKVGEEYNERAGILGYDFEKNDYLLSHTISPTAAQWEEINALAGKDISNSGLTVAVDENGEYWFTKKARHSYYWDNSWYAVINGVAGGRASDEVSELNIGDPTYYSVYNNALHFSEYYPEGFFTTYNQISDKYNELWDKKCEDIYCGLFHCDSVEGNAIYSPEYSGMRAPDIVNWDSIQYPNKTIERFVVGDGAYVQDDFHSNPLAQLYLSHEYLKENGENAISNRILNQIAITYGVDYGFESWNDYLEWEAQNVTPIEENFENEINAYVQQYGFANYAEYEDWVFENAYNNPNFSNDFYDVSRREKSLLASYQGQYKYYITVYEHSDYPDYPEFYYTYEPIIENGVHTGDRIVNKTYYCRAVNVSSAPIIRGYQYYKLPAQLEKNQKIYYVWQQITAPVEYESHKLFKTKEYNITIKNLKENDKVIMKHGGLNGPSYSDVEAQVWDFGDSGIIPTMYFSYLKGEITVPEGFQSVGCDAFRASDDTWRTATEDAFTVNLPSSIINIGAGAFWQTNVNATLNEVQNIGSGAFYGTNSDNLIIESEDLKMVKELAFEFGKIKRVLLPEGLEVCSIAYLMPAGGYVDELEIDCDIFGDLRISHNNSSSYMGSYGYSNEESLSASWYNTKSRDYTYYCGPFINIYTNSSINNRYYTAYNAACNNREKGKNIGTIIFGPHVLQPDPGFCGMSNITQQEMSNTSYTLNDLSRRTTFIDLVVDKIDLSQAPWTVMPAGLFYGVQADEIILPEGIAEISYGAFAEACVEKDVKIPAGVVTVNKNAFLNSDVRADFSDCHLTYIGMNAFMNSKGAFSRLTIYDDTEFVDNAFYHSNYERYADELRIEQSLDTEENHILDYSAFDPVTHEHKPIRDSKTTDLAKRNATSMAQIFKQSGIEKLVFGESVTQLPTGIYKFNSNGEHSYYNISETNYSEFYDVSAISVVFEGLEYLPDFAFEGNATIREVTFSDNLECIGFQALNGATNIKHINLPVTATPILLMPNAFENTGISDLISSEFSEGATLTGSFDGTDTTNWNVDFTTAVAACYKADPTQNSYSGIRLYTDEEWEALADDAEIFPAVGVTPAKTKANWYDPGLAGYYLYNSGQFNNCNALRKVEWGRNLGDIPERLFEACANLDTVQVSKYLGNVEQDAFKWCNNLEKFVFWGTATHVDDENVTAGNLDGVHDGGDMTIPMWADIWCYSTAATLGDYHNTYLPLVAAYGDVGETVFLDEVLYQETQGTQTVAPGEAIDFSKFKMGTLRRDAVVMESDGLEELTGAGIYTGGKKFSAEEIRASIAQMQNVNKVRLMINSGPRLAAIATGYTVPVGVDILATPWTIAELPDVSNFDSVTSDYDPTDLTLGDRLVTFTYIDLATGNPVTDTVTITVAISYDIEFQNWDGSEVGTYAVASGLQPVAPTEEMLKPKTGYHYVGWEDVDTGTIYTADTLPVASANKIYRAAFAKNVYTIRWQDWDGTILKTEFVPYQDAPLAPDVPAREGFKHTGWTPVISVATQDVTYTTLWDRNTYLVTFVDHDNSVISQEPVEHGAMPVPPADPVWIGHTFKGWTPVVRVCTEAATYRAVYEIDTFNIRWLNRDGSVIDTTLVPYGEMPVPPAPPVWIGHTLTGWTPVIVPATEDTAYTTVWDVDTFDIQFVDYDGSVLSNQVVAYGNMPLVPEVGPRPGFVFTGFTPEVEAATKNQVYVATYVYRECTVTFVDWDDTVLGTDTVLYGMAAVAPADPTREGYTFTGWDKPLTNIVADVTIKAQYTETPVIGPPAVVYTIKGTVSFNSLPEKDIVIAIGGAANLSATTDENGKFTINTAVAGDYTITVAKADVYYTGTIKVGDTMSYADVTNSGRYEVSAVTRVAEIEYSFVGMPVAPPRIPGNPGNPGTTTPPGDSTPKNPGDPGKPVDEDPGDPPTVMPPVRVDVSAMFNKEPMEGIYVECVNIYTDEIIGEYTDKNGTITIGIVEPSDYIVFVHETAKKKSTVIGRFSFTVDYTKVKVTDKFSEDGYSIKVSKVGRNLTAKVKGKSEEETIDIPVEEENNPVPKTGDNAWIFILLIMAVCGVLFVVRKRRFTV